MALYHRVKGVIRKGKAVPPITLYGPFETNKQSQVVNEIVRICYKYRIIPFIFKGFNYFDNSASKVIYLDIEQSQNLVNLRYEISKALSPITHSKSQEDKKGKSNFKFHSTIAFKDIWNYINEKEKPSIKQNLLRITILKNSKILYEYDLIQHKLLNRRESLSKNIFSTTIKELKTNHDLQDRNNQIKIKNKETILTKIKNILKVNIK